MPTLTPFVDYATDIMYNRYSHTVGGVKETWCDIAQRVTAAVMHGPHLPVYPPADVASAMYETIAQRKFIPGGRILSQAGRAYHNTDNCYCLRAVDSREGWADLAQKTTMMFMSGGGVGISYDDIRPYGTTLQRSGGIASGPVPLIQMINSIGAAARQGGERRGAIYASLKWDHPDIEQFIRMKYDTPLAHTNISVRFDSAWQEAIGQRRGHDNHMLANSTFMATLASACSTGDPGFQFDDDDQILRNACTEIISADDGDSCCLGSINIAAIDSLAELAQVTELATLFLLCNTLYTDLPTVQVATVKHKNRRIGLGLMGVAEWFVQRQLQYGQRSAHPLSDNIGEWLSTWQRYSDAAADAWSDKLSINRPIATRAIAPTGTISIAGGMTTPGIDPIFHTAYRRTYNTLKTQQHSDGYAVKDVIDPIVHRWLDAGYNVRDIDTAYTLSQSIDGIERRLKFQAFVQQYVDNAISTTINLPKYVEGVEEKIAPVLLKYLPQLRGVTFYPDGAYDHQPVVPLDIDKVLGSSDTVEEVYESCRGDGCGS